MAGQLSTITLTIPAGQSESDAGNFTSDMGVSKVLQHAIVMPSAWTNANLTFQISFDGIEFFDVCDFLGDPMMINVMPGSVILVPDNFAQAAQFMKVRSGTRENPVPQEAAR